MRPGATEQATFARVPFSHLVVRALDRRWTGTLFVDPPEGEAHVVELRRGLMVRVGVPDGYMRLGTLLVDSGVFLQAELDLALAEPPGAGDEALGKVLVARGTVDARMIDRMLLSQLIGRLVRIFSLAPETSYSFCAGHDALAETRGTRIRIDPLRILWEGLRAHGEHPRALSATLDPIRTRSCRLRQEGSISRFGFDNDALAVVNALERERTSLAQLVAEQVASGPLCRLVVYALRICRFLDFSAREDRPASRLASPQPSRPQTVGRISLCRISVPRGAMATDEPEQDDASAIAPVDLSWSSSPPPPRPSSSNPPSSDPGAPRFSVVEPTAPGLPSSSPGTDDDDGAARTPDASEASSPTRLMTRRRREIRDQLQVLEQATPCSLLGLDEGAFRAMDEATRTNALWAAYEATTRRWHPDSCPEPLADQRASLVQICTAVTGAFETLLASVPGDRRSDDDG